MYIAKPMKKRDHYFIFADDTYSGTHARWMRNSTPRPAKLSRMKTMMLDIIDVHTKMHRQFMWTPEHLFQIHIPRFQQAYPNSDPDPKKVMSKIRTAIRSLNIDDKLLDRYVEGKILQYSDIKKRVKLNDPIPEPETINVPLMPIYDELVKLPFEHGIVRDEIMNIQAYEITSNQMTIKCPYCIGQRGSELGIHQLHYHCLPEKVDIGYCQRNVQPNCGVCFTGNVKIPFNIHITKNTIISH